jgi:hypothetical protein
MVLSVTSADTASHTAIVAQTNSAAATEQYLLYAPQSTNMLNTANQRLWQMHVAIQSRG